MQGWAEPSWWVREVMVGRGAGGWDEGWRERGSGCVGGSGGCRRTGMEECVARLGQCRQERDGKR